MRSTESHQSNQPSHILPDLTEATERHPAETDERHLVQVAEGCSVEVAEGCSAEAVEEDPAEAAGGHPATLVEDLDLSSREFCDIGPLLTVQLVEDQDRQEVSSDRITSC